ncbi:NAD(P)-dependent oxidoreductase [Brevibacillus porteri]|uniref:NAD(P)-dependent oxidoreductase n=1 Tax=Brevibacillus porteri TaxID=2126350 RepID=UPI003632FBE6
MKSTSIPASVSVIGLGNMGVALADAFVKGGHPTTVWNRSADRAKGLVEKGAVLAGSVAEAITASSLVVVCLSTYKVMQELLEPLQSELSGRVIVNLTTGTPEDARKTAKWVSVHGGQYLDGAIMAVPQMIGLPETLIFYGGSKALFETYEPTLKLLGGNAAYLSEDHGVPLIYDLSLLTMMYGAWYGSLHAHALLSTANITATEFLPYATNWMNQLVAPLLSDPVAARARDEGNFKTDVSNMNTNKLGLEHIINASKEQGISVDWLLPVHELAVKKVAEGYGADSFERVIEAIRKPQVI